MTAGLHDLCAVPDDSARAVARARQQALYARLVALEPLQRAFLVYKLGESLEPREQAVLSKYLDAAEREFFVISKPWTCPLCEADAHDRCLFRAAGGRVCACARALHVVAEPAAAGASCGC